MSILSNRSLNLGLTDPTDTPKPSKSPLTQEDRLQHSQTGYIPIKPPPTDLYTDDPSIVPEPCPALEADDSSERTSWGSSSAAPPPSPPSPLPYPEGKSHFSDVSDTEDTASAPRAGGRRASILQSDFVQERLRIKKARTTLKAIRPPSSSSSVGLCKGALRIRDDPKTGLGLAKTPTGLYTSALRWQCRSCWFSGGVYGRAKQLKHDQRVFTDDATGIRYRWMFLAKSHVARKQSSVSDNVSDRFGCVFCVDAGRGTAVYESAPALMGHIAVEHRNVEGEVAARNKCVAGEGVPAAVEWEIRVC
jgi:hypothetical protein